MSIFTYIKSHAVLAGTLGGVAVVAAVIGGRVANRQAATDTSASNIKHVSLVDAGTLLGGSGSVSADGVVQSVSQVDLRSQISAPISYIGVSLGDHVSAGQTLAELSNADIRAQLDQAKLSVSAEGISLDSARRAAVDAIHDSYLKADEAIHTQIDPMLYNSTKTSVQLSAFDTDPVHYQGIIAERTDLTNVFNSWNTVVNGLSDKPSDTALTNALRVSEENIRKVQDLLDSIAAILNNAATIALPSDLTTINTWKATVTAARSSMSGVSSSLTATDRSFSNALVTQGGVGAAPSTVAQSGVKNLEAQLAKTLITSPISGTVAALPLRTGELATPGTLIATVVGSGSLQVDAFASAEDIARIVKGAKAYIEGTTTGMVSSIATAVNPTNKKVEVKVLITDPERSRLVIGQNVNVRIAADQRATGAASSFRVPIQDVKIVPGEAYVFTVDDQSKLVRHDVTLGNVQGDYVEVTGGLTPDMQIVSPVYELEAGQEVSVD